MADPTPLWQQKGFESASDYASALFELSTAAREGRVDAATAARLRSSGSKGEIVAVLGAPAGAPPSPVRTDADAPLAKEKLLDTTDEMRKAAVAAGQSAFPERALTQAEKDRLSQGVGALSEAPRDAGGQRASAFWQDLVSPEPGEWPITTALRPQAILTKEQTDAIEAARARGEQSPLLSTILDWTTTKDPESGQTYENTIGWLGRLLGSPASALVGVLDPSTSVAERVAQGEGFAGGARDVAKVIEDLPKAAKDKGKTYEERNTSERAFLALAYTLGFVGDLLVPFDLGVGDVAKSAAAGAKFADAASTLSKVGASERAYEGLLGALRGAIKETPAGSLVSDPRIIATNRAVAAAPAQTRAVASQWVRAVEGTARGADNADVPVQITRALEDLALPTRADQARELVAVARQLDPDPGTGLLRAAIARRIAQDVEQSVVGLSRKALTRVGNVIVPKSVAPLVRQAIDASPLRAARDAATVGAEGALEVAGPEARTLIAYLRDRNILERWASERPGSPRLVYPGDVVRVTSDEWNDLVRVATEAEAVRLAEGAATHVRDLPDLTQTGGARFFTGLEDAVVRGTRRAAVAQRLEPEQLRKAVVLPGIAESVKDAARHVVDFGRAWTGAGRVPRARDLPPAIQEWLTRAERMVAEAPTLLLNDLRKAARTGTGKNTDPAAVIAALWNAGGRARKAFDDVYRAAMPATGPSKAPEILAMLFPQATEEAYRLINALSQQPGTLLHGLVRAMTEGASGKTPSEAAAIVIATIGGRTLGDLMPADDLARLTGMAEEGIVPDAATIARLSAVRADQALAQNPVGLIAAWLVRDRAQSQARAAAVDLLRSLRVDPDMSSRLLGWARTRIGRIARAIDSTGAVIPRKAVERYVVDELIADMTGQSSQAARAALLANIVDEEGRGLHRAVAGILEREARVSPAETMRGSLLQMDPTPEQARQTLAVLDAYLTEGSNPTAQSLIRAVEQAAPNLDPFTRQRLAARIEDLVGGSSELALEQVRKLPLVSTITDDVATIMRAGEASIEEIVEQLLRLPPEGWTNIVRTLSGVVEPAQIGASRPLRTITGLAKSGMLGGWLLPNLGYHAVNALTAPLIVWGQLGGPAAARSFGKAWKANRATRHLYARLGGIVDDGTHVMIKTADGRTYTTEQVVKLAVKDGALGGQAGAELTTSVLEDLIRWSGQTSGGRPVSGLRDVLRRNLDPATVSLASEFGQTMDARFRFGVLIDALESGASEVDAAKLAREALFDYNNMSQFERQYVTKILWFYRFLRSSIASLFQGLVSNPARVRNILKVQKGWENQPAMKEQEEAKGLIFPEWADSRSRFTSILKDPQTGQHYALFGPPIPMGDAVNQVVGVLALANAMSDPEYYPAEKTSSTAAAVAGDLASRMGPFVGLGFDLVTGERPTTFGVRPDPKTIDASYVVLLQATGTWDLFRSLVPVRALTKQEAPVGKEATYFQPEGATGGPWMWEVQDSREARRSWALVQDAVRALGQDRAIRDLLGPAAYHWGLPSGVSITPGADLAQGDPYEDILGMFGVARPFVAETEAEKAIRQQKEAVREQYLRERKAPR